MGLKQKKHLDKLNSNQKRENNRNWKGGIVLDKSIGFLALLILCIPSIIILREYFGREK